MIYLGNKQVGLSKGIISDVRMNNESLVEDGIAIIPDTSARGAQGGNTPLADGNGMWLWGVSPSNRYIRFAEMEIYYDCPYEYTTNGMAMDDDYYYVAIISRSTVPENFEKSRILKFSRSTYELVATIEGDYGHANTLCVDRANHLLYSAQLNKYYVENDVVKSQTLTGIDVFDVSGNGITYIKTIETDRRSAGVAFNQGQLYMYYANGEIYKVDQKTGELELYVTLPIVTQAFTQSIDMDDQYIYWLAYQTSASPEEGNIGIFTHSGDYLGQISVNHVMENVGYLGELEDICFEGGSVYVNVSNVDRTEPAPYNNMRQVVIFRGYLTDVLPPRSLIYNARFREYPAHSWGSVTAYVNSSATTYHPVVGSSQYPFRSIRAALRYLMYYPAMNYFISISPGTYSETLLFESINGRRFRFAKNGNGDVILNKKITIYDGDIEFRNITFDTSAYTNGIIVLMNSFRQEPTNLSIYSCTFDRDTAIGANDTIYGVYCEYPFAAIVRFLQDRYTANATNLKHYLPYCKTESWQRPSDRIVKDISTINGGNIIHSRISATSNVDLNDIFNPGTYMVTDGGSAQHIPSGSNGWLIVLSQPLYGASYHTLTKQIWLRMGTAGSTDNVIMFRTFGSGNWGPWYRVALDSGAMPSGTKLTIGTGIFIGFITGSKKNFQVTIPLTTSIPTNLTTVTASDWSFTMRNNGTTIASININDTTKVASYTATILPSVGIRLSLNLTDAFVSGNMSNMTNNDPTIMFVQGNSAALTFTDPNAQPDTPDIPDDDGEVTPDPDDGTNPIENGQQQNS